MRVMRKCEHLATCKTYQKLQRVADMILIMKGPFVEPRTKKVKDERRQKILSFDEEMV
jgi:hypothetical protein